MKKLFFNRPIRILFFSNTLITLASAMMGPIYALFVAKVGGDLLDASLTGAIFFFAAGIAALISGKYSDKIKENELIIVLGYGLIAFGYFLYLFVDSIWFLFLVQIIIGFGDAIWAPAFDSLYSKHIDHHKSGMEWGSWESMNYFVFGIGAVVGGVLVSLFSFNLIFIIMMLISAGSALYIYFLPRNVL